MNQTLSKSLIVAGLALFLYQLGELLGNHSTWSELSTPGAIGEFVKLGGGVLLAVVGALGTDIPKLLGGVPKKKTPVVLLAVALGGAMLASGCAHGQPQTDPRAALLQTVRQTETVGILTRGLVQTEIALHDAGKIPDDQHRAFLVGAKTFATAALAALEASKNLNKPDAGARDAIKAALELGDKLITQNVIPIKDPEVRATLISSIAGIEAILAVLGS